MRVSFDIISSGRGRRGGEEEEGEEVEEGEKVEEEEEGKTSMKQTNLTSQCIHV